MQIAIYIQRSFAAKIGGQDLGQLHRTVNLLAIFQNCNQASPDGEPRPVQRMDKLRFAPVGGFETCIHASRLEIPRGRDRADLAIGVLTRQPRFDVIGTAGTEPHITGTSSD